MHWFRSSMEHSCAATGPSGSGDYLTRFPTRSTCCGHSSSTFPYTASVFDTCLADFANHWGSTAGGTMNHGFWFDASGQIKVMMVQGGTTQKYSQQFSVTETLYDKILAFFETAGTTPGLNTGFMASELRFFALQQALTDGAWESATYSTIFALAILVFMTRRILSSIVAAVQITLVVTCVLGVFVQIGWKLNIVESVIMSVSVGVACDFSAHLANAFNKVKVEEEDHVPLTFPRTMEEFWQHYALSTAKATGAVRELGVTLSMGFLTTFLSGVVLLFGTLYFFQQFGVFMTTLMAFSLTLAFCFLMPILATFGWVDRIIANAIHEQIDPIYKKYFEKKVD